MATQEELSQGGREVHLHNLEMDYSSQSYKAKIRQQPAIEHAQIYYQKQLKVQTTFT